MAYTDKEYFLGKITEEQLDELLKDKGGVVQESYLTEAIADADDMIDGYIRSVVQLPLAEPIPRKIKVCSYDLATYELHKRIQYVDVPELIRTNYNHAIATLKGIADGTINLNIDAEQEDKTDAGVSYSVNPNVFDRNSF